VDPRPRRRPAPHTVTAAASRAVGLVCAVTLAALLAACAPEPSATPEPSSSASASVGAEPTPTTSEEPSSSPEPTPSGGFVDDSEVEAWTITADGIGPVRLGMDFTAALQTLPAGGWEQGVECDWSAFTNTQDKSYSLYFAREFRSASGPVVEVGVVWSGAPGTEQSVGPRGDRGLGVGSTRSQVLTAYPDAAEGTSPVDGSTYLIAPTASGSIVFTFATPSSPARSVAVSATTDPPHPVCG